ncbi:MAG: PIN domain-containing protein [Patescibacteria group bacterium]
MSQSKDEVKSYLLIDTCVIQYVATKDVDLAVNEYLLEIKSRGFDFVISDISTYESLQGVSAQKENELLSLLNSLDRYPIDANTLIAAAQIKTLYDLEKVPQNQISDGDKIIAATSILTGAPIVTSDLNDFPRPYFVELERKNIIYKHKNVDRMIPIYILSPNIDVVNHRFSIRPKT